MDGLGFLVLSLFIKLAAASVTCNNTFDSISATTWVNGVNPGWNLGNTLDATPTEGSWNNPPVDFSTFDDIKNSGFKGVRLPVTWADHFITGSPSWTINQTWLQRVSDVVDAVIERDLYVLVNVHHDATMWADVTAAGANYSAIEEQFYRLWYQVGETLGCKSSLLAFETINEPPASTNAQYAEINKLQGLFIQALADSGGFNSKRVVTLIGPSENADLTDQFLTIPSNITNPYAIQYHYYSPYDFIFGAWGKTIWGSYSDKQSLDSDLSIVRGNFTDVPVVIGEWSASSTFTETAARWKYFDFFIRTAAKYTTATILWDNGEDQLDRAAHKWRDPTVIDILMSAFAGVNNTLADSTEDANAPTQETSAYIFHKAGTNGAPLNAAVVQYDAPTLGSSSAAASSVNTGSDLTIPITWKGLEDVAAVKAETINGTYLVDTFTQYDGPLQQGRTTYSSQYNWDGSAVTITAATIQDVVTAGQTTVFTFEFYPRAPGNAVNYTLTV
ncbi:MAG: hypothetical protein Q9157_001883 [Trypethelium eluteriae]